MTLNVFIGVDRRQLLAATVLQASLYRHASVPLAITWLLLDQLPIPRRGLTEFTYTRYLVPWLMDYQGTALFLDADMLARADIAELFELADRRYAVQVVKCSRRFEWPSLMLFNCAACKILTPEFIEQAEPQALGWGNVGELPREWNHCIGYDDPREDAKLLHYTAGIPVFEEVKHLGHAQVWQQELRAATHTVPWEILMGNSVHAESMKSREEVMPERIWPRDFAAKPYRGKA